MTNERTITESQLTTTSNEWMRRFIEEPEKFDREFQSVTDFLKSEASGEEPSYGARCTAYQFKLLDEMSAPDASTQQSRTE